MDTTGLPAANVRDNDLTFDLMDHGSPVDLGLTDCEQNAHRKHPSPCQPEIGHAHLQLFPGIELE
ncbi:hypothetical protein CRUP_023554, partial [Coryphaenoides rupestris]